MKLFSEIVVIRCGEHCTYTTSLERYAIPAVEYGAASPRTHAFLDARLIIPGQPIYTVIDVQHPLQ
jgi:hypothetical protein